MEQTARTPETKIVAEKLKAAFLLLLQWKREMTVGGLKRKQRKSINEPPVNVCLTLTGFVFFRYEKVLWMDSWALWSPLGIKSWGWPIFGEEKNKIGFGQLTQYAGKCHICRKYCGWKSCTRLICSLSLYSQGFIYPRCFRILSINSIYIFMPGPCFTAMFTRGVV